ncbi:coiled-coil domain-containing protein 122 isoform X3 [Coregonus clupeaformis]|uniref:coiled-coil domain-containing protein 122 isoform X3 n=1 Tax=Coregonus clupeaformis TaxID=59861 RepID=UPI001BE08806|nr:coiled-coil domain-containing protein 122 isoform X3 [Coregonus clupeaformis]
MANSAELTMEYDVTAPLPFIAAETHGGPDFSLTQALEDVSQQGYAQIVALQEKQQVLSSLQAILSDIEKKGKEAEVELKSKVRQILILEGEMEHLQRHMQDLGLRSITAYNENTELRLLIEEEEDNSRCMLAGYNTYRNKMEGHRAAVLQAESQTRAHRELVEKRALVRVLTERREELRADLENPEGNAVKQAQIQNRRYDAIVKRLHCQLMKAQSGHRQLSDDIYHMEREIQDLKRHLEVP